MPIRSAAVVLPWPPPSEEYQPASATTHSTASPDPAATTAAAAARAGEERSGDHGGLAPGPVARGADGGSSRDDGRLSRSVIDAQSPRSPGAVGGPTPTSLRTPPGRVPDLESAL